MSEESEKPRPFDVGTIEYLIRLMRDNDISELDLAEGDERIRLRRGPRLIASAAPAVPAAPVAPAAPPTAQAAAPEKAARKLIEIKSPTVGTYFAQKEPGAPPYVTVGSRIGPTTVVGLIMAMKVYSEIEARCSGTIAEVCVNNEDAVEFNTVLFRVDPS